MTGRNAPNGVSLAKDHTVATLPRTDLEGALAFIRCCDGFAELQSFRIGLLPEVRRLVRCDSAGYNELAPDSGAARLLADPAEIDTVADREALGRWMDQHPLVEHHSRTRDGRAVQLADFLRPHELHELDLYDEFFRPLEVEHQIVITVPAPGPMLVGLSLQRRRRPFSERERALLDLIRPHLVATLDRLAARAHARQAITLFEKANGGAGPAVITLGSNGTIEASELALRMLRDWFEVDGRSPRKLPEELASWLAASRPPALTEDELAAPGAPLRLSRPGRRLEIHLVGSLAPGECNALLLRERREGLDPDVLRELGLTRRECQVLSCAAIGMTTPEIAAELVVSPRTVQKHLSNIFGKLGVSTRTAAAGRAMELSRDGLEAAAAAG